MRRTILQGVSFSLRVWLHRLQFTHAVRNLSSSCVMIVLMIRYRLDNSLPLYSQAWASEDSFPLEVFPSLLCPQCHFSGPRGRCACDTYDYVSWIFCKLERLIHTSVFHPFLSFPLPHHINPPPHLRSYFFPLIHSVFSLLATPLLLVLHCCPISSILFSCTLNPILYLSLSHPLSFPHWFTFFSFSPH